MIVPHFRRLHWKPSNAATSVSVPCTRTCIVRQTLGQKVTVTAQAARSPDGGGHDDDDDDDDDNDVAPVPGRALRVERLLANLGYGKRRECQALIKKGRVTRRDGGKLKVGDKVCLGEVVLDGDELDPPSPLLVALHKPVGYVVTSPDDENIPDPVVYDLLPYRFARRRPFLSSVGRLDKDTSGLLLLTDDGALLHRINSPRRGIWKVYEATLAEPMTTKAAAAAARKFASGSLVLEGDYTPLLPAKLELIGERLARVAICEGKYHQVRRMFAAVGSKVVALHRISVGGLTLGSLPAGDWRHLTPQELQLVFEGPKAEDVLGAAAAAAANSTSSTSGSSDGVEHVPVSQRDGGATASTSTSTISMSTSAGSDGGGGGAVLADGKLARQQGERRLTKKERKKGGKGVVERKGAAARGRTAAQDEDLGEEEVEEEDNVADFELLPPYDGTGENLHFGLLEEEKRGEEEEDGPGSRGWVPARRRQQHRGPAVRQGTVQGMAEGISLGEQLDPATYGIPYDDAAADVVMSAGGSGGVVRKYREGARWRRRRDALRQMLPS